MDYTDDEARVRRWTLPGSALAGVIDVRAEVVAAIETSARESELRGDADRAGLLREASTTLRAMMRPEALRRTEPDIAALMEAEGVALRPGPRAAVAPGVLPALRRAILGMRLVQVCYAGASRVLCPYGLLYGGRGWLVAHVEALPDMRLWRLDRIVSVTVLDKGFRRRDSFDLAAYAAQSFGVFQEDPIDVVLRFTPEAADDAAGWVFHPSQTMEREPDGPLLVRFTAGGVQEMCWHLFTWGTAVTVVGPEGLRVAMWEMAMAVGVHSARTDLPASTPAPLDQKRRDYVG
jgi:predicted DNA-binding transcriptional regulator YafY